MSEGIKHDSGKLRPTLILGTMGKALQAVIEVGEFGARKYSKDNWLHVEDAENRYTEAMYRHALKELQGEKRCPESNLFHAAHAAWNALARLELMLRAGEQVGAGAFGAVDPIQPGEFLVNGRVVRVGSRICFVQEYTDHVEEGVVVDFRPGGYLRISRKDGVVVPIKVLHVTEVL